MPRTPPGFWEIEDAFRIAKLEWEQSTAISQPFGLPHRVRHFLKRFPPMMVKVLESFHYPDPPREAGMPRFGWNSIRTYAPTWQDIRAAILRLDRDEWPYLWLHTDEPPEDDEPINMLSIMGGRGEFDFLFTRRGAYNRYLDTSRGFEEIQIWASDQGSWASRMNLCDDLALVLKIARRFAEQGDLDPEVTWEEF